MNDIPPHNTMTQELEGSDRYVQLATALRMNAGQSAIRMGVGLRYRMTDVSKTLANDLIVTVYERFVEMGVTLPNYSIQNIVYIPDHRDVDTMAVKMNLGSPLGRITTLHEVITLYTDADQKGVYFLIISDKDLGDEG
jgi:hypothetical protein